METNTLTRKHDEARQGESLSAAIALDSTAARKFYIESYGCAMNFADSEVVASILQGSGFTGTGDFTEADLVLINTCSIREKAEQTIRSRLHIFRKAEIEISGRRKTGRPGGWSRCVPDAATVNTGSGRRSEVRQCPAQS